MKVKIFFFTLLITIFINLSAYAKESSKEYALLAKKTWTAFECSGLAELANDRLEQERLFTLGYNAGKSFLAALKEEKIKKENLDENAPVMLLLLLQGPNADFMLGRIFESAVEAGTKNAYDAHQKAGGNAQSKIDTAKNDFWSKNCNLITTEP